LTRNPDKNRKDVVRIFIAIKIHLSIIRG